LNLLISNESHKILVGILEFLKSHISILGYSPIALIVHELAMIGVPEPWSPT